ncbi:MAG: 3-ketoacyl-ACP reductase [Eudoraea sp.]|nr:3-ketoacyl-ACP reductase [Eudoraea sp.]
MIKNALITGGTRGIGLGIAKSLAKSGHNLVINGRRTPELVEPIIRELSNFGTKVVYCQGDVSSSGDRDHIMQVGLTSFGQIHVLINNAGVGPLHRNDLLECTEESYDRVMSTNLQGPFFLSQKIARHMIANNLDNLGCIVNISSISATMASVNRAEYCLSKAGMSMMTKLFATRLGEYNIPVYEIRPGIIATDMTAESLDKYRKRLENGLSIQSRLGQAEDVGKVVAALVDGNFPYSTGQVIMVDGGITVPRL